MTAGSLGQGLSCAIGMALAARMDGKDYRTYCIIGDGESQEGQIWEALMYAGNMGLDNLTIFIDYNRMQIDGYTDEINSLEPLPTSIRRSTSTQYALTDTTYRLSTMRYPRLKRLKVNAL